MSLSKGKCWYSNNCLHFVKHGGVPLLRIVKYSKTVYSIEQWGQKANRGFINCSTGLPPLSEKQSYPICLEHSVFCSVSHTLKKIPKSTFLE